jgi:hypothetical protein
MDITRIAIIDVSGSMDSPFMYGGQPGVITRLTSETHKFEAAKEYLRFAIQKMPRSSNLILIAFASSAEVVYRGVASDSRGIENAIATLRADGSSTNLAAAFQKVIDLLATEGHAIRPVDVVTDGLSNNGNPIQPARELQKRFGAYIHIYLIDPTPEGKHIADEIVGSEGEGEVDPVASAEALRDRGRQSAEAERAFYAEVDHVLARHAAARRDFFQRMTEQERPKITAASPEIMTPQQWSTVDVFIHLRNYQELVQREIQRLQHRENIDYSRMSSEFPRSLPEGCPIRVMLSSTSLRANPPEMTIYWYEPYNRLSFRVSAIDHDRNEYSASLDVNVFADDLPVASMRLPVAITSSLSRQPTEPATTEAQWYEDIFASYAREDLEVVEHLKERYAALGLYLFVDLDDLRSGARWRPELFKRIDSSDLFQLFWSHSSKHSEYVAIEWEHALRAQEIKGGRFIRPVYWEEPIPEIPGELAEINFRRITFAKR